MATYYGQPGKATHIDHVFTNMGPGALSRAYIPPEARLADHVPVVAEIRIPVLAGSRGKRIAPEVPVKLDASTPEKIMQLELEFQ